MNYVLPLILIVLATCYQQAAGTNLNHSVRMEEAANALSHPGLDINFTERRKKNFWRRVEKLGTEAGCWIWMGWVSEIGYGYMAIGNNMRAAHRVSWVLHFGAIPPGEGHHGTCVLHDCDTPLCVNPAHLHLGTQQKNVKERDMKGRRRAPKGEQSTNAVLTDESVRLIRKLHAEGIPKLQLSRRFKAGRTTITRAIDRLTWTHII
jgi:hypothetical protein